MEEIYDSESVLVKKLGMDGSPDRFTHSCLRGDPLGSAIFDQARYAVGELAGDQTTEISEEIAAEFVQIIERYKRVGWTTDPNAENAMRQDMDDYRPTSANPFAIPWRSRANTRRYETR